LHGSYCIPTVNDCQIGPKKLFFCYHTWVTLLYNVEGVELGSSANNIIGRYCPCRHTSSGALSESGKNGFGWPIEKECGTPVACMESAQKPITNGGTAIKDREKTLKVCRTVRVVPNRIPRLLPRKW
jgi:hypothetical protein